MTELKPWVCPTCLEHMPVDYMPHRGCAGWSQVIERRNQQTQRESHGAEHRSENQGNRT